MSKEISCGEPRLHPVQDISIKNLKEEFSSKKKSPALNQRLDENYKNFEAMDKEMDCVDRMKENLSRSVSFDENPYLKCRWKNFLKDIPTKPLIIKSYDKLYERPKDPVRRMILNGQIYSSKNEILPIPWFQDPRL